VEGEFMLSMLGSCAQESSKAVSDNCKWRIRKNFSEGVAPYVIMLGYRREDNSYVIVPEEAEVVRMIFSDFLSGMGRNLIVKKLNELGINPIRNGKWCESGITQILTNEKYKGDMLLQKTYVADHISKKKKTNQGELPRYLAEESHEPIIEKAIFDKVQEEIKRRADTYISKGVGSSHPYAGKIVCSVCGKKYVRKKRKGAGGIRYIWICPTFSRFGKDYCGSKLLSEDILDNILPPGFSEVGVHPSHLLEVLMADGTEKETWYVGKQKKESWTDEMKEAARGRAKECSKR